VEGAGLLNEFRCLADECVLHAGSGGGVRGAEGAGSGWRERAGVRLEGAGAAHERAFRSDRSGYALGGCWWRPSSRKGFSGSCGQHRGGVSDFDAVFDRERLPRVELRTARRRAAVELPRNLRKSGKSRGRRRGGAGVSAGDCGTRAEAEPAEAAYAGYQLIRNVLAAYAEGCSFCVLHDERRPDLREAWFAVMAAVKNAELRTRCKVLTWQELAALLPEELQDFWIASTDCAGGRAASGVEEV